MGRRRRIFLVCLSIPALQGYLAHKEHPPARTRQEDYALRTTGDAGGIGVSYERGSLVGFTV